MTENKNILTDDELRSLFKTQLPKERRDEWFVKKTMNRLPERRRSTFSKPEVVSYIVSALILVSAWIWLWVRLHGEQSLTYGTLMSAAAIILMSLGLVGAIAYPIVKRG